MPNDTSSAAIPFAELLDLMITKYQMGYSISIYPDGSTVHTFLPLTTIERSHNALNQLAVDGLVEYLEREA